MASPAENPPPKIHSEGLIQELISYFDEIKNSLSKNPNGNGHVSGAIVKRDPLKVPVHLQDGSACVPCWVGHGGSDTAEVEVGGCSAAGDGNKSNHDSNDQKNRIAQAEKLQRELCNVKRELSNFRKLDGVVASSYRDFADNRIDLHTVPDEVPLLEGTFHLVAEMVQSLKGQAKAAKEPVALTFKPCYLVLNERNEGTGMKDMVENASYYRSFLYGDLQGMFEKLNDDSKKCLMYFSVFPENAVLRKSLLKNWWIGEGLFANNADGRGRIDMVLNQLLEKGFIEPFIKKRRLVGFKVDPLIKFVLIKIAEGGGFSGFDLMGVPSDGISPTGRAFLVKHGEDYSRISLVKDVNHHDLGKLKTLFNVNDSYPDFKEDWFSKLKNLEVLSLGGLHGLFGQDIQAEEPRLLKGPENMKNLRVLLRQHIELEEAQFLKGMKNMKKLKFLGLQGISRLLNIPESIGKLSGLAILDLCACHNLESLPKDLAKLKNLTHLDISECFLLDEIPKGVASLSKLQVLKGFLVGSSASADSCTLTDLRSLTELRKLSIYTNNHKFPDDKDLAALRGFKLLENLAIIWGGKLLKYEEKVKKGKPVETLDEAHNSKKLGKKLSKKLSEKLSKKLSKGEATEQDFKVGMRNESGKVDELKPEEDSTPASIFSVKEDTGMDKIPEDGEIESSKQSHTPARPPIFVEAMKNNARSFRRILSGKNQEGSVRMRNIDNNLKEGDVPVSAGPTQEAQADGNASIQRMSTPGVRKLELQCYPGTELPGWVVDGKLKPQKKLYIGGGNLRSLGRGNPEWMISILRLKFLRELDMDWMELKKSFPKLVYLEKVRCPKLSFFPCDNTGVWWKRDCEEEELVALKLGLPWSFLKRKAY